MKKILVAFILLFALTMRAEDSSDLQMCNYAKRRNTIDAWKNYLKKFPKGACAAIAENELEEAGVALPGRHDTDPKDVKACQMARKKKNIKAWRLYLRDFPDGECAYEAKIQIEEFEEKEEYEENLRAEMERREAEKEAEKELKRLAKLKAEEAAKRKAEEEKREKERREQRAALMELERQVELEKAARIEEARRKAELEVERKAQLEAQREAAARNEAAARREHWLRSRTIGNLVWSDRSSYKMKWDKAKKYCENLTDGGYTDWRLPNIDELRVLIQNHSGTQSGGICKISEKMGRFSSDDYTDVCGGKDGSNFSKLGDPSPLWSSSALSDTPVGAWIVEFDHGGVISTPTFSDRAKYLYYVRCVR